MDTKDLERESIKSFLSQKLRSIEVEIFKIAMKHGVKSVEELDEKLKEGLVEEDEVLSDYQELDYYESQKDHILKALNSL
ncbi:MAG: hypothetical protein HZA77_13370 [Candidatus Schekmanbacteria bacterium]|nr:hypothetical protein [Candidatus Schekmanbacteria bacterium]